jgi:hypothetical protein
MSALRHFSQLFSTTPSALRAVLLGAGLAFAATDPRVAVVGKAAHAVVQTEAQAGSTQALAGLGHAVAPVVR